MSAAAVKSLNAATEGVYNMDGSQYLVMGLVFGVSAGLAPGPLLTLVVSESLARGISAGIRVALAPLISDLPIVVISLALVSLLSDFNPVLGLISLAGGVVILKMGTSNLRTSGVVLEEGVGDASPLYKGVLVNILSPHPYLFWISVGGPTTVKAWTVSPVAGMGFIFGFYLLLIGSKLGLAFITARTRTFMTGNVYTYTMKILGAVLCGLAVVLIRDGVSLLGWG